MAEFRHDFGWTGVCVYCGVTQEAIKDNLASPNCDILRHKMDFRLALIVGFGVFVCSIPLIGIFL